MKQFDKYIYCLLALGLALGAARADSEKRKVGVTVVEKGVFEETVTFPAGIYAGDDVVLGAEVPGRVMRTEVDEGDRVMKGARILAIDAGTYEAALSAAQADADLAAKELARGSMLLKDAVISRNDFDALSARSQAAQAALDLARINLEKAHVCAPFDGVVDRIMPEEGAYAGVGDPVARVINLEIFEARCAVPEKDIAFIHRGDKAVFRHKALGIEREGTVVFAARAAEEKSMAFPVKARGKNLDPMFLSGMIAEAEFVRRRIEGAIAVPVFCIMQDSGGTFVYLEKQGRAVRSDIKVGGMNKGRALVIAGLEAGDRLISTGQRSLEEGDEVVVAGEK